MCSTIKHGHDRTSRRRRFFLDFQSSAAFDTTSYHHSAVSSYFYYTPSYTYTTFIQRRRRVAHPQQGLRNIIQEIFFPMSTSPPAHNVIFPCIGHRGRNVLSPQDTSQLRGHSLFLQALNSLDKSSRASCPSDFAGLNIYLSTKPFAVRSTRSGQLRVSIYLWFVD
ncbi:hypothetical protein B0H12DRAFT_1092476, partial [Mycena haematopus]